MKDKSLKIWNWIFPIIALALLIAIWAITAKIVDEEIIVPTLSSTFKSLGELLSSKSFYLETGNTLLRSIISYVIAFVLAITLAIISSMFKHIGKVLSFYTIIMRAIPTMSIILLALIWMSTLRAPMLVAFLVIFPILYTNILSAINSVDKRLVEMATVYCVPKRKQILKLYIPEMSASLFSTMRATISLNFKLIIAAEVMAQTRDSIGVQMKLSMLYLEMDKLFAWTIVAIIVGAILEGLVILTQYLIQRGKK